jgi:hypothetical protein
LEPFAFEQVGESKTLAANVLGGLIKASNVSLYKGKTSFAAPKGDEIRIVVVAIRGTAIIHDWLVNFNDATLSTGLLPKDKVQSEFLVSLQKYYYR